MRIALPLAFAMLIVAMPADARPAPKPAGATYHYKCPKGRAFSVRYDKDYTAAFIDFGRKHNRLPAAMAASGSRYAKGRVEFWEHHGDAMLNGVRGGDIHDCKIRQR